MVKYIPPEDYARTIVAEKRASPQVYNPNKKTHLGCLVVGALSADPAKFTKVHFSLMLLEISSAYLLF